MGLWNIGLLIFTITANSFYWTTSEGFIAGGFFFRCFRLFENKGVVVFIAARKTLGCRIATNIAINTRRVYIISSSNILFNFVFSVWQLNRPVAASW